MNQRHCLDLVPVKLSAIASLRREPLEGPPAWELFAGMYLQSPFSPVRGGGYSLPSPTGEKCLRKAVTGCN